jgi:hypothetical protein
MPEWGTKPSNHYLPRRKNHVAYRKEELERVDNPLKKEDYQVDASEPSLDDVTSW